MASSTISNILNTALNATLEATGQKPTVLTNTNDLDTIFEPGWYFWSDSIPQNVPANRTYAINDIFITPTMLSELIKLINDKKITNNQGKEVFSKMLEEKLFPSEIVKKYCMEIIEDDNLIDSLVDEVIS